MTTDGYRPFGHGTRLSLVRWTLTLALVASGLSVVAGAPSASAASATKLVVSPTTPIRSEKFTVGYRLPTRFARPVSLQRYTGGRWKTIGKGRSTAAGRVSITTSTPHSAVTLRIRASSRRHHGKTYKTRTSPKRRVTTTTQSVTLSLAQAGAPGTAIAARATASPARSGRTVTLQRATRSSWSTVSTGRQSASGTVVFSGTPTAVAADGASFRVVVAAHRGAPSISSVSRTFHRAVVSITMDPTDPAALDPEGRVRLSARTSGDVRRVRFFVDGRKVGQDDTAAPWSVPWMPERGEHDVTARAIGPHDTQTSPVDSFTVAATAVDDANGLPAGFGLDTVQDGFDLPTSFAMSSTGAVFVSEKAGRVMMFAKDRDGSYSTPRTVIDIRDQVHQGEDRGLIGVAVDPRFSEGDAHQWVYVSYVYRDPTDAPAGRLDEVQQVQRFDIAEWSGSSDEPLRYDADHVVLGRTTGAACWAEANIRTPDCVPLHGSSHTIGDLSFDTDGNLLVGVGDGALFYTDDGLNGRTQSLRAQDKEVLAGKILRIDPDTGRGVAGNPYFAGDGSSNASRVLAYGFRNPFRVTVRQDGLVVVGDVGDAATEELDVIDPDAGEVRNYGWPCWEGDEHTAVAVSTGPEPDPATNPWDQCRVLRADAAAVVPPVYSYPHTGGASITGGAFYTGDTYPAEYHGAYFFGDYAQNFMRTARMDHHGEITSVEPFAYRSAAAGPVKFLMGPDGTMWYLSIYTGSLRRIVYDPNPAPGTCAIGTFSTRYYNLADPPTSLAKSSEDYPAGYGWLRLAEAAFPVDAAASEPDCATGIHLDPTTGPVHAGLPADDTGVRWQGRVRLEAGTYEFDVRGKDWIRVTVDDDIIHEWFGFGGWLPRTARVTVPAGVHNLRVELVDDSGEASADVTWKRVGSPPRAAVEAPTNGKVLPGSLVAGVQSGTASYSITSSADPMSAELTSVTVLADLLHHTGDDVHVHPYAQTKFDLSGRVGTVQGQFDLKDSHAPAHSVFRIRARVTDAAGAVTVSTPTYVCLNGNQVGICAQE